MHPKDNSSLLWLQVFNYIITAVIVLNIIVLASTAYGESTTYTKAKEDCNYAFTAIFIIEAAIKITGLGWRNYWRSGGNKFDFFLILMAIVDIGFTAIASHGSSVSDSDKTCKTLVLLLHDCLALSLYLLPYLLITQHAAAIRAIQVYVCG